MTTAPQDLASAIAAIDKRAATRMSAPLFRTGTVTAVNESAIDVVLDSGETLPNLATISEHVREVGRRVGISMNGVEPVVVTADLIAAGTIIAGMLIAEFELVVGQTIHSAGFQSGMEGWAINAAGDAEFNDVTARGVVVAGGGPNLIPNRGAEQDTTGWTAAAGTLARDTTGANIRTGAGAFSHALTSGTESYITTPEGLSGIPVEDDSTYSLFGYPKPGATGDKAKVAIRFYDATGTFLAQTDGQYVTGITAYPATPASVFATPGQSTTGYFLYYPNSDGYSFGVINQVGSASNLYQSIDETVLNTGDYVYATGGTFNGALRCTSSVASGALTGRIITSVQVTYVTLLFAGSGDGYFEPWMHIGSTDYTKPGIYFGTTTTARTVTWSTNPATGVAWTAAEVEAFRSGGTNTFGFTNLIATEPGGAAIVYQMTMRVNYTSATGAQFASVRAYFDPLSAGGSTVYWDDFELRKMSLVTGGDVQVQGRSLPRGVLARAERTTGQGSITGVTDLTNLAVTVTLDGTRRIKITGYAAFESDQASDVTTLRIAEGATELNEFGTVTGTTYWRNCIATHEFIPTSGAHTYKLQAVDAVGTATMQATTANPAFILVEDLGAI